MENFFVSLFFIFIIFIFSGVFKNFIKKSVNKYEDENSGKDEESSIFNDNTHVEEEFDKYNLFHQYKRDSQEIEEQELETQRETIHDSAELFQDYSLKKKNETFSKDSYLNKNMTSFYDNDRNKKTKQKKQYNQAEIAQEQKIEGLDSLNKIEDITVSAKKGSALDKIKKFSYLKQAVLLSEVLGRPKGLDN